MIQYVSISSGSTPSQTPRHRPSTTTPRRKSFQQGRQPERLARNSPGQRPGKGDGPFLGYSVSFSPERAGRSVAPFQGLNILRYARLPRALPWALTSQPFGLNCKDRMDFVDGLGGRKVFGERAADTLDGVADLLADLVGDRFAGARKVMVTPLRERRLCQPRSFCARAQNDRRDGCRRLLSPAQPWGKADHFAGAGKMVGRIVAANS
jgi:hypothetical protein